MTFIYPALLAGLALTLLPVLLHLILRQQPKRLPFPAFQFLARKATSNRRKLQLRHLLLLLMRILMIALMCLAVARPRILNERLNLSSERPAAAVVVIDTSLSMGYTVAGKTRLEEAKSRALEIITGLPANSRIAVLDSAEFGGDWQPTMSAAKERVATRELQASSGAISDPVATAYRLFDALAKDAGENAEPPSRFLYVLTDRAPASWDTSRTRDLIAARDRLNSQPLQQVVVDLGVEKPADVAILEVRMMTQVISANKPVVMSAIVQSINAAVETQVQCRIIGLPDVESRSLQLDAGQSKEASFTRRGLKPGFYQGEVTLATTDALLADNTRYFTFEVREPRPVLVLCDRIEDAKTLRNALQTDFPCDVKTTSSPEVRAMAPLDLAKFRTVILLSVDAPSRELWEKLDVFVAGGGGLIVFPGGEGTVLSDYNSSETPAERLLPGTLKQLLSGSEQGTTWTEYQYQHPMIAPFRDDVTAFADSPPRTYRYWEVTPRPTASIMLRYADQAKNPAILETTLDRQKYRGKVLLFTTPFDDRRDAKDQPWNDYSQWWLYLVLTNRSVRYVGGSAEDAEFNHLAGRAITVPLPSRVRATTLNLAGPGLSGPDSLVSRPEKSLELRLTQPRTAGNYKLATPDQAWLTEFSVNPPAEEFQLSPRVPEETLAEVFGAKSILAPGVDAPLRDKLDQHFRQPVELFPWLMLIVLMLFVLENLLANRFYRREE